MNKKIFISTGEVSGDLHGSLLTKALLNEAKKQSPVNYVEKLKIPFMIIHGGKDIRTPYKEAVTFMKELDKRGITYEKMIVEKEGHGFSDEENRIEKLKRISAFFNKYLAT